MFVVTLFAGLDQRQANLLICIIYLANFSKRSCTLGHPVGLCFVGPPVFKPLFGVGQIQGKKAEEEAFVIQKLPLFRRKMVGKGLEPDFCFVPFIEISLLPIEAEHRHRDGQPRLPEVIPRQVLKFLFPRVDLAVCGRISVLKWPILFEEFFAELCDVVENRQQASFKPPDQLESVLNVQPRR